MLDRVSDKRAATLSCVGMAVRLRVERSKGARRGVIETSVCCGGDSKGTAERKGHNLHRAKEGTGGDEGHMRGCG